MQHSEYRIDTRLALLILLVVSALFLQASCGASQGKEVVHYQSSNTSFARSDFQQGPRDYALLLPTDMEFFELVTREALESGKVVFDNPLVWEPEIVMIPENRGPYRSLAEQAVDRLLGEDHAVVEMDVADGKVRLWLSAHADPAFDQPVQRMMCEEVIRQTMLCFEDVGEVVFESVGP